MENRVIKFRGLCAISKEWVFGDLIHGVGAKSGNLYILPNKINLAYVKHCDPLDGVKIIPESVGQFTGLYDSKGNEIYEGDILRMRIPISINGTHLHDVVVFSQGYAFWFKTIIYPGYTDCLWFHYKASQREIIGNVHYENSHLTEQ